MNCPSRIRQAMQYNLPRGISNFKMMSNFYFFAPNEPVKTSLCSFLTAFLLFVIIYCVEMCFWRLVCMMRRHHRVAMRHLCAITLRVCTVREATLRSRCCRVSTVSREGDECDGGALLCPASSILPPKLWQLFPERPARGRVRCRRLMTSGC